MTAMTVLKNIECPRMATPGSNFCEPCTSDLHKKGE